MPDRSVQLLEDRLRSRARRSLAHAARPAAVLVPLLGDGGNPEVLLFERSQNVIEHKGEICFPGGSLEPGDDGPVQAALREAHEELALEPQLVRVLGLLDDVETNVSNYTVTPVVGHVASQPQLVPEHLEVARIIRVRLGRLFEPSVESSEVASYAGVTMERYAYTFDGNRVWGATARILHSLIDLLR